MIKDIKNFLGDLSVRSRNWLIAILGLFLLSNNVHLYEVYNIITGHSGLHVVLILIVLDLSVLTFAAHGKKFAAFLFSAVIFSTTLAYFFSGPTIKDNPMEHWGFATIGVLLSLVYATGVYVFTEIFVQKDEAERLEKRDAAIKERKDRERLVELNKAKEVSKELRRDLRAKIKVLGKDILERESKLKFTPKNKRESFLSLITEKKSELSDLESRLEEENNKSFDI